MQQFVHFSTTLFYTTPLYYKLYSFKQQPVHTDTMQFYLYTFPLQLVLFHTTTETPYTTSCTLLSATCTLLFHNSYFLIQLFYTTTCILFYHNRHSFTKQNEQHYTTTCTFFSPQRVFFYTAECTPLYILYTFIIQFVLFLYNNMYTLIQHLFCYNPYSFIQHLCQLFYNLNTFLSQLVLKFMQQNVHYYTAACNFYTSTGTISYNSMCTFIKVVHFATTFLPLLYNTFLPQLILLYNKMYTPIPQLVQFYATTHTFIQQNIHPYSTSCTLYTTNRTRLYNKMYTFMPQLAHFYTTTDTTKCTPLYHNLYRFMPQLVLIYTTKCTHLYHILYTIIPQLILLLYNKMYTLIPQLVHFYTTTRTTKCTPLCHNLYTFIPQFVFNF